MKYKLNGFIFTAIVAAAGLISIAGTASAQTIPGTYIEIDDTNTQLQEAVPGIVDGEPVGTRFSSTESGGTEFFDAGGFVPLWEERMIELSEGGNAPFNTLGFTGNSGDLPIVTTLTGLQAGTCLLYTSPSPRDS